MYVCGCQERVADLGDQFFECLHCDRFCDIDDCDLCLALEASDVEQYLNGLDEEDDDESSI